MEETTTGTPRGVPALVLAMRFACGGLLLLLCRARADEAGAGLSVGLQHALCFAECELEDQGRAGGMQARRFSFSVGLLRFDGARRLALSGCARARSATCRRPSSAERRTRVSALTALWRGSLPAFSGPLVAASWAAQRAPRLGPAGGPAAARLRPSPLAFGHFRVTRMLQHAYELGLEQPCWCLPRAHATAVLAPRSARATPPGPRQYTLSV